MEDLTYFNGGHLGCCCLAELADIFTRWTLTYFFRIFTWNDISLQKLNRKNWSRILLDLPLLCNTEQCWLHWQRSCYEIYRYMASNSTVTIPFTRDDISIQTYKFKVSYGIINFVLIKCCVFTESSRRQF
jgi:hypothetical protein